MDVRLKTALNLAKTREIFLEQKRLLKLKYDNLLLYAIHGGIFKITPELLNLCDILIKTDRIKNVCIYDIHDNPIKIEKFDIFYIEILAKYFEVVNEHYFEFNQLKGKEN